MTTTFSLSDTPTASGSSAIGTFLLEPVLVIGACLFWLIVLPIGGLFCAAVFLYDRLADPHHRPVHAATILRRSSINPLALRQADLGLREGKDSTARIGGRAQA
jgi:hypothetical protein